MQASLRGDGGGLEALEAERVRSILAGLLFAAPTVLYILLYG